MMVMGPRFFDPLGTRKAGHVTSERHVLCLDGSPDVRALAVTDSTPVRLGSHQFLRMDRHLGQGLDSRAVLAQSVLHHAEIESRDHDVIPVVPDSAQGYVQHSDNPIAQWFVAVERDGAKKFLAFRIA
jgi:hypothetical protein